MHRLSRFSRSCHPVAKRHNSNIQTINSFKLAIDKVNEKEGPVKALEFLKSQPDLSTKIEIMEQEADYNLVLEKPDYALDIYTQILTKKESMSPEALATFYIKMAECHSQIGELESAIHYLNLSIKEISDDATALHSLADVYFQMGKNASIEYDQRINFEKAIKALDKALAIDFEEYPELTHS
jgi:tetratricopeptide (TPR) repeat protein